MALSSNIDDRTLFHPLDEFYTRANLPLPRVEQIDGKDLPAHYRRLLAQDGPLTPQLERHHGERIHLRVLRSHLSGATYVRQVVLALEDSRTAVGIGAVKVDLDRFDQSARRQILAAERPLGYIVSSGNGEHRGAPWAFIHVVSDSLINTALDLPATRSLYGRRNTLFDRQRRCSAEIVEILTLD